MIDLNPPPDRPLPASQRLAIRAELEASVTRPSRRRAWHGRRWRMRGLGGLALAVSLAGAGAGIAAAVHPFSNGPQPAVEYNCLAAAPTAKVGVEPTSIALSCATAGLSAVHITWVSWQATAAYGKGFIVANLCTPNCALGTFKHFPADITLHGVIDTTRGPVFTTMTVTYTATGPRRVPTGSLIRRFTLEHPPSSS